MFNEAMVRNEPCGPNAGLCRKAALLPDDLGLRSTQVHQEEMFAQA